MLVKIGSPIWVCVGTSTLISYDREGKVLKETFTSWPAPDFPASWRVVYRFCEKNLDKYELVRPTQKRWLGKFKFEGPMRHPIMGGPEGAAYKYTYNAYLGVLNEGILADVFETVDLIPNEWRILDFTFSNESRADTYFSGTYDFPPIKPFHNIWEYLKNQRFKDVESFKTQEEG